MAGESWEKPQGRGKGQGAVSGGEVRQWSAPTKERERVVRPMKRAERVGPS